MNNRKTAIRFFTIADYEDEEIWLHNQHKNGWKLLRMIPPCFFIFEKCAPEDVAYRLDYKNGTETGDYFQLFRDYGWEYIDRCFGWLYFRKAVSETNSEQDGEIFSDAKSRIDLVDHVAKTRLRPVLIIFFCCLIPNFILSMVRDDLAFANVFTIIFAVMILLYIYLLVHCGSKLRKLREKYRND